ncbi:unnamed protein product [Rhizophagus irregularis]|nr:unnamed protein product [Rhizophagus irregularis]
MDENTLLVSNWLYGTSISFPHNDTSKSISKSSSSTVLTKIETNDTKLPLQERKRRPTRMNNMQIPKK